MCTCEPSLSYVDPDVNRGSLMSKEVDKHGIDSLVLSEVVKCKWPQLKYGSYIQQIVEYEPRKAL